MLLGNVSQAHARAYRSYRAVALGPYKALFARWVLMWGLPLKTKNMAFKIWKPWDPWLPYPYEALKGIMFSITFLVQCCRDGGWGLNLLCFKGNPLKAELGPPSHPFAPAQRKDKKLLFRRPFKPLTRYARHRYRLHTTCRIRFLIKTQASITRKWPLA